MAQRTIVHQLSACPNISSRCHREYIAQSDSGNLACCLGRYEDDLDEGEWFLYTGSGGRDLSGNKRVNKIQSFDQTFDKMNKALLISCEKGLPVRVVRSHKVPTLPAHMAECHVASLQK